MSSNKNKKENGNKVKSKKQNKKISSSDNNDSENSFEIYKAEYIKLSNEIYNLQLEINKKDEKREQLILKIRDLQLSISSEDEKMILNYNTSSNSNNINILTPSRVTDKETDIQNQKIY